MSRCAVWIASQEYAREAVQSAKRFHKVMPDIPLFMFADTECDQDTRFLLSEVFSLSYYSSKVSDLWYLNSTNYMLLAYELLAIYDSMIFFDTDTYMIEPIYDVYQLLEHGYDIAAAHAPGRHTAQTINPIPDSFPELNIGVVGIARTAKSHELLTDFYLQYSENKLIYKNNDQAPLREVLWNTKPRLAILPPEYNCRFKFGFFARYPIKVLHGRADDIEAIAESVNAKEGMRIWGNPA